MAAAVEDAAATDDPWKGIVAAMTVIAERQARDRGLMEAVATEIVGSAPARGQGAGATSRSRSDGAAISG